LPRDSLVWTVIRSDPIQADPGWNIRPNLVRPAEGGRADYPSATVVAVVPARLWVTVTVARAEPAPTVNDVERAVEAVLGSAVTVICAPDPPVRTLSVTQEAGDAVTDQLA
jgi:hypothetical protein